MSSIVELGTLSRDTKGFQIVGSDGVQTTCPANGQKKVWGNQGAACPG